MTGIVILAAGTSSRMGKPKQLLPWKNTTLIRNVVDIALQSDIGPVAVVLGSSADLIFPELATCPVHVIHNELYPLGQGTSLHAGTRFAIRSEWDGVIFMVCDQPEIEASDLQKIYETALSDHTVLVAARYADTVGVPAYFDSTLFKRLLQVPVNQGAKSIFKELEMDLKEVSVPNAILDLDTMAEYEHARDVQL
jgi:molybdenum cofactor cytidylyltransferase